MHSQLMAWLLLCAAMIPGPTQPERKSWVDDSATFLSSASGRHCVIGRSARPCLSQAEAEGQALADAAGQLMFASRLSRASDLVGRDEWVSRIATELSIEGKVRDRSLTLVHKPYGDLWSAMVLVDAAPSWVAARQAQWSRNRETAQARRLAGALGICIVVLLARLAANAVTRGYYHRRVGAATILSLALLVWVMVRG